jgi:uncharacterized Ntn-hydrolase superfamily protein
VTYSIVAADQTTRQVGGAGTSCLGGQDVYVIYAAVPGRGVVHAQARYSQAAKQRAAELLESGVAPADIIATITQASIDAGFAQRQYGIVDVSGAAAGFTGDATMPYAEDRQGTAGSFTYSVQGNILTSAKVLDQAASAFMAGGCDLAERLMNALEAGAVGGEGDSRCTPDGIPADSAFLQIEAPAGDPGDYLALRVESSGNSDPLPLLREQLQAWRADHPCPPAMQPTDPVAGSGGMASGGGGGTGSTPAAGSPAAGVPTTGAAGSGGIASGPANANQSDGCGCRLPAREADFAPWLLLGSLLVVALGRRRARAR